jgi:hypothetical protein
MCEGQCYPFVQDCPYIELVWEKRRVIGSICHEHEATNKSILTKGEKKDE